MGQVVVASRLRCVGFYKGPPGREVSTSQHCAPFSPKLPSLDGRCSPGITDDEGSLPLRYRISKQLRNCLTRSEMERDE